MPQPYACHDRDSFFNSDEFRTYKVTRAGQEGGGGNTGRPGGGGG